MSRLYVVAQSFYIDRNNFDQCFNTLKAALSEPMFYYGIEQECSQFESYIKIKDVRKVENIIDLFKLCRFRVELDNSNNISAIDDTIGEFITLRKWFFNVIAPYVQDGSYLEFRNTWDELNDEEDAYLLFKDKKAIFYELKSTVVEYTYYNYDHGNIKTTYPFN